MKALDIAWLAGLFEGEGAIIFSKRDNGVRIQINSTDHDVLVRAKDKTGCGFIYGPFDNGPNCKPLWHWQVQYAPDVARLLLAIGPMLCERRLARAGEAAERLARVTVRARPTRELVHGTTAGYKKHKRRGEVPCVECKRAHCEYMKAFNKRKRAERRGVWTNPRGQRDSNVESNQVKPAEVPNA